MTVPTQALPMTSQGRGCSSAILARMHRERGLSEARAFAEGLVAGVAFWLRTAADARAAFDVLQLAADQAVAPILKGMCDGR